MIYRRADEVVRETLRYIQDRAKGLHQPLLTPWKAFNEATEGGIELRSISILAGLSGVGKTAVLNQLETGLIDCNPDRKLNVLSFNFEMFARNLIIRKMASSLNITTKQVANTKTIGPIIGIGNKLSAYPIYYVDHACTVDKMEEIIREFIADNPGELVVLLDHSLLVMSSGGDERKTLIELMNMCNKLKKEFEIAFVILSQLNRNIESTERILNNDAHYPQKSDLFGSDSLYQYADIVLVLHNPKILGINSYGPKRFATKDYLFWHFLKMREGEPQVRIMKDMLKYSRVEDLDEVDKLKLTANAK